MSEKESKINWSICVICQLKTQENLQCPADSSRKSDVGAGYKTLSNNIIEFNNLDCLPVDINIEALKKEELSIEETFSKRKARWHKSCYAKFNSTKLERAKKRHSNGDGNPKSHKYTRSNATSRNIEKQGFCFFCDIAGSKINPLHLVTKLSVDNQVRKYANILQDQKMIAKLSEGDLIALDAYYHTSCLVSYYKKGEKVRRHKEMDEHADDEKNSIDSIVLAELVAYIEESRTEPNVSERIFKLSELVTLYRERMESLGDKRTSRVHSSRLKARILSQVPSLQAYNDGREVLLAFQEDVGNVLQKAQMDDDEAVHLMKTASFLRKEMFSKSYSFEGSFNESCQKDSVPHSLLSLIQMIIYGPSIKDQATISSNNQASLSISQLIQYNSYIRRRGGTKNERRNKSRETPLPLYVGLSIHAKTRSRELIESFHDLGLSVSYDRVLAISSELGNSVAQRYQQEGVVCPPNLCFDQFTTAAVDNIDHNPSSTTAQDSFHGTGISMFQHVTPELQVRSRNFVYTPKITPSTKAVAEIPESYTHVKPSKLPNEEVLPEKSIPNEQESTDPTDENFFSNEFEWVKQANKSIFIDGSVEKVSWSSYHASDEAPSVCPCDISALLPLFPDEAKSVSMITHAMRVIKDGIRYLNPNQTPVIAMDQPLFAVAKQIQWTWKENYGEDKYVIMFGGLHIEMGFMKAIGEWLEDSGWKSALVDANIASCGTADSFLKASSVKRTRRAHQITACSLYTLLVRSYESYVDNVPLGGTVLAFEEWCSKRKSESPQFYFWYVTMELEFLLLTFVRSLRKADFELYVGSVARMLSWFFALNHTNYSRWLSVHVHDMRSLKLKAPDVVIQFNKGNFVVRKSTRRFSAVAIDQAHEQNNAIVKGDGGAVGLTESPQALRRWMVSGPELARVVNEFEHTMKPVSVPDDRELKHHEEQSSFQLSFSKGVKDLVSVFEDLGNPFSDESGQLVVLDTKEIADQEAVKRMQGIKAIGDKQSKSFMEECLMKGTTSLYNPIKRNQRNFFRTPPVKSAKAIQQVASLKSDRSLFSRLFISCQTREGNLDDFFMHENQGSPPSLSNAGMLRLPTKKSDLIDCLQDEENTKSQAPSGVQVLIIDGAVAVNMVRPKSSQATFADYANESFIPYIKSQMQHIHRVEIIFDEYLEDSLKATTRISRGSGVRMRVGAAVKLPRKWETFLREDHNKQALFRFLAESLVSQEQDAYQIVVTYGSQVLSSPLINTANLSPCSHEEADTRMILHVYNALQQGHNKILLRTVDTDVVVLAVALVPKLPNNANAELWIKFGTGKHLRFLAAHEIARGLGPQKSLALPFFHAFTGCDTVSCFSGRGKKTAFQTWKAFPEATTAFLALSCPSEEISSECMSLLERFVVILYDRTCQCQGVNDARKSLFSKKGKPLESIPPTQSALLEHTKRASLQAGHCWGQALKMQPKLPNPGDWGWTQTANGWQPFWTALPSITESCRELTRCGCKKNCAGRCSCFKAELSCTALCSCPCET